MEESRDPDMVRPIPAIFAAQPVHEYAIKSAVRVLSLSLSREVRSGRDHYEELGDMARVWSRAGFRVLGF